MEINSVHSHFRAAVSFCLPPEISRLNVILVRPCPRKERICLYGGKKLDRLFHSLAVPGPGSSRRWIWNRERRSAPAESQHSFPSSIGRQLSFSNIYPTVPPPSAQGNRCRLPAPR